MSNSYYKKMIDTLPKIYNPEANPVIAALLLAISESDNEIATQISNGKDQIFVRSATGQNLDKLANSLGVSRPSGLGLSDTDFQELVPNLSLKPKQIKKAFYDTSDVFWGPLFSRTNITSNNAATYNVSPGDQFKIKVDNGDIQTIEALSGEIDTPGAATAEEMQTILSKIDGVTVTIIDDALTGDDYLNIRTNTPGSVGTIEILDSTMISASKLDFTLGTYDILDLDQRVSIYNISPNELIIELPSIVPSLRRTLKGSHHFHDDGTLEPPRGTEQGIWAGSFLFNPDGSGGNFTLTSQKATLQQSISKGNILTSLTVDDTSLFENSTGDIMLNFGKGTQEVPISYRGIPNANTILIDPSYVFANDHSSGEIINVISSRTSYTPRVEGQDLAIYLTSPSDARQTVQAIMSTLKAGGIVITFVILAPEYKYILDNPYLTSDDAPTSL